MLLILGDIVAVLLLQAGGLAMLMRQLGRRPAVHGGGGAAVLIATVASGAVLALIAGSGPAHAQRAPAASPAPAASAGKMAPSSATDALAMRATGKVTLGYVLTGDAATDDTSRSGLAGLGRILAQRTAVEPGDPQGVDVTTDDGREPVAIPDLRAVREQSHLQRSGAVRRRSLSALAIRIETLLITSHREAVRPPREVALGLALYLDSLADSLPSPRVDHPGAAVFAARCGRCHSPPTWGGGLVPAWEVGTDPTLARSATRGTGSYRVPSLRGVGARRWLLHDGSVEGLDALLDPARLSDGYRGARGAGAIPGHVFGTDLPAAERSALRAFLSTM